MAQSLGSPIAAVIFERCGSWIPLFETIIAMGIITGPLALFVLKGLRRWFPATAFVTNDRAARRLGRGARYGMPSPWQVDEVFLTGIPFAIPFINGSFWACTAIISRRGGLIRMPGAGCKTFPLVRNVLR